MRGIATAGLLLLVLAAAACGGSSPRAASSRVESTPCGKRSTRPAATVKLDRGAHAVSVGGNSIWVANPMNGTVAQVDAKAARVSRRFRGIGAPVAIAATGDRAWVAARDDDHVLALDPTTGRRRVLIDLGVPVAVDLIGRDLWALSLDDGSLYAVDVRTRATTVFDLGLPLQAPAAMAPLGQDVWVLGQGDHSIVGVSTQLRRITSAGQRLDVNSASDVATGQGFVWVADPKDSSILRVDPETEAVRAFRAPKPMRPVAVAYGACGLWAVDAAGRVARFDPRTLRVSGAVLRIGHSGGEIADDGAGGAWVTDPEGGWLVRVVAR